MVTNRVQIFMFKQSLIWKMLRPDMELSRNPQSFRATYKASRKLRNDSSAKDVLIDLHKLCKENNFDLFTERDKQRSWYKGLKLD